MPFDKIITKPIGYKEAAGYLSYLNKSRTKLGFLNSAGGTFNIGKFNNWVGQGDAFSGIMCWFCIDDDSNFILAIEPRFNFEYDRNQLESIKPVSEYLFTPSQVLDLTIFEGNNLIQDEIERRLRNFNKPMLKPVKRVKNLKVVEWVRRFKEISSDDEFSSYGFTYFNKNELQVGSPDLPQISNFLNDRRIRFVRYFFGLRNHINEKLRVILVPVGIMGNNLEPQPNRLDENNLLQYSWPPNTSIE